MTPYQVNLRTEKNTGEGSFEGAFPGVYLSRKSEESVPSCAAIFLSCTVCAEQQGALCGIYASADVFSSRRF